MFTVSCKNDCIKVQCVKFCTTVRLSFAMGISRNEVELDLECQLQLYCFGFIERDCSNLFVFSLLLYFIYCHLLDKNSDAQITFNICRLETLFGWTMFRYRNLSQNL